MRDFLESTVDRTNLGRDIRFGDRTIIKGITGRMQRLSIGDNVQIGDDVRIIAPEVEIGDFTVIHNHATIYGYEKVTIGANCWIGQNAILNCTASLKIGRGCTISAQASIWTHFSGGDPVEGSIFDQRKPAVLEDDVWLGVDAMTAPVTVGAKSLILAKGVVTKDVPPNQVWGGNPAQDMTARIGQPYRERTVEEKYDHMCQLLSRFQAQAGRLSSVEAGVEADELAHLKHPVCFTIGGITIAAGDCPDEGKSVFDVRDRTYSKRRTAEEIEFMHFLLPTVKFYPRGSR